MSVKWRCFIALYNKLESTELRIRLAAGISNQVRGQFCYFCFELKTEFEFLMSLRFTVGVRGFSGMMVQDAGHSVLPSSLQLAQPWSLEMGPRTHGAQQRGA